MDVAAELDRLRQDVPGCDIVVLADLSTDMVLASSAEFPPSQERLDQMTAVASAALVGPLGEGAAILLEGEPEYPDMAIVADGEKLNAFVMAADGRQEALLFAVRDDAGLARISDCARDTLGTILAGS